MLYNKFILFVNSKEKTYFIIGIVLGIIGTALLI